MVRFRWIKLVILPENIKLGGVEEMNNALKKSGHFA